MGAGRDKKSLALAPVGAHHWWVDPVYDPRHYWYQEKLVPEMFSFFKKKGISPTVTPDSDNKFRSDLQLKDKTVISFMGGIGEDSNNYPSETDVVFVADKSFSDPQTLVKLKTGGLYVSICFSKKLFYCVRSWIAF